MIRARVFKTTSIYLAGVCYLFHSCSTNISEDLISVPQDAIENSLYEASQEPFFETTDEIPSEWWTLFNDPQLSSFIETAYAQNPTLLSAQKQILAAAYNAQRVRSLLFPTITWGADRARQKLSKTGVIPFNSSGLASYQPGTPSVAVPVTPGGDSGIPVYFTLYETEFNFNYNFDFWHKNRNLFRAALGQIQADIAEEAYARLSLGIALAKVYFSLQADYQKLKNAQKIVENRVAYTELIKKRIKANLGDSFDLNRAESDEADARLLLYQIQSDIAVNEYQLKAYLAGNFEEEITDIEILEKIPCKIPLPKDLPVHLLGRRPDIISQLWLIESAGRQIKAAQAGFYPDFNLAGFFGYQSVHFRELFKWPSSFFNVDPAVTLPIFNGGLLIANLRGSEVNYDLAILDYNESVIKAVQEVLESVALVRNYNLQFEQVQSKVASKKKLNELTQQKVLHKLNSKLDELTSEWSVLLTSNEEMETVKNMMHATLMLIKSIGGGYDTCYEE